MTILEEALKLVPDMDIDLAGCGCIAAHGLPPPVVITLARRPDRWVRAERHLAERGIRDVIKATAVDGQAVPRELLEALMADPDAVDRPLNRYLQMTRPAVGCFLSHLAIWKRFLASGEPQVLILEDDALPAKDYRPDRGRAMLARMPRDADMLLVGCTIMDGLAEPSGDAAFKRVYYYNGTFGYLLTRKGCLALLPRLLPIETHIDNQISLELVDNRDGLAAYAPEPRLIEHDFSVYSDVYVPVVDEKAADHALDAVFKEARRKLLAAGARLFPMHVS